MIHEDITLGPVRVILGDCLKVAPTLECVDAVITDPPYGMGWEGNQRFSGGNTKRGKGTRHIQISGDGERFNPLPILEFGAPTVMWGANHFWDSLPAGAALIWQKRNEEALGTFLSDAEVAFLSEGCGVYVFRKVFAGSTRAIEGGVGAYEGSLHPNQKPVALMSWCMDMAKVPQGALILDPYMGSGTTLIAAIRTGRRAIGIEIDPTHYRTAVERVRRELAQPTLQFETQPQPKQEVLL